MYVDHVCSEFPDRQAIHQKRLSREGDLIIKNEWTSIYVGDDGHRYKRIVKWNDLMIDLS